MADQPLRIYKAGAEFISDSAERLGLTRQTIDVLGVQEGDSPIRIFKFGGEILCRVPPRLKITRQTLDVLASEEGESSINLYKFGAEFIYKRPSALKITRQIIDVLASEAGEAGIRIYKFGAEIVCRASPILEAPLAEPSYWTVFAHNWASVFKIETEYSTDISKSQVTQTEDRRALASKPYRTISIKWTSLKRESLQKLLITLRKISAARMFIPLYSDQIVLVQDAIGPSTTMYCFPGKMRLFVNQRIAIVTLNEDLLPYGTVYLREIKDIEYNRIILKTALPFTTFKANRTIILPMIDTELILDPNIKFSSDLTAEVELDFQEVIGKSALPPTWTGLPEDSPNYQGYPIFNFEPNWERPPDLTYKREGSIEAQGRGFVVYTEGERYKLIQNFELFMDRDTFFNYQRFFDSRRGRQRAFWMIDLDQVWEFLAISGVDNKFVDIVATGDFTHFNEELDYIGIVTKNGFYYVREVVSAQDLTNYYRITVTDSIPELQTINVKRVARARLSRFQSDISEETWVSNNQVTVSQKIIELLDETSVEL